MRKGGKLDEENLERFFLRKKEVLSNPQVFQIDTPVDKIVPTRDTSKFFQEISTFIKYKIPNNILIVGESGCGKTVTARYLLNFLEKLKVEKKIPTDFIQIYINCSNMTTTDVITTIYAEEFRHLPSYNSIVKLLHDLPTNTLLFLDEVDRAKDIDELLYKLTRPREVNPQFKHNISLILISNNLRYEDSLNTATRSSLNLKRIDFSRYSSAQLYKILENRVEIGFKDKKIISNSVIKYLSTKIYEKYNSDSRIAILGLLQLAQLAETKDLDQITEKEVDQTLLRVLEDVHIKSISQLETSEFFTLYSCYKFQNEKSLYKVYEEYDRLMLKYNLPAVKKTKFYSNIEYLETHNLIEKKTGLLIGTLTSDQTISIKVKSEVIESEFRKRTYTVDEQINGG